MCEVSMNISNQNKGNIQGNREKKIAAKSNSEKLNEKGSNL